jgi:signal transduction histidine kinase/PAS domain-containing protein
MFGNIRQFIEAVPYSQLINLLTHAAEFGIIVTFFLCLLGLRTFFQHLLREKSRDRAQQLADELAIRNRKLRQEIIFLDELLNQFPFPVWRRLDDLRISYCNEYYCQAVKGEQAQVISESRELSTGSREVAQEAITAQTTQVIKKHLIDGDQRRLYEIHEIPLTNGTIGFARDLSEQERTEQELKHHRGVQSDLMESITSGVAIFQADGRLRYYNQSYMNLWKLDEAFLESAPNYGEILERLRELRKLPEQHNFQSYKKEQIAQFSKLIRKEEEFMYLPDGSVYRIVKIPHEDGGLLFSYTDLTDQINLERSYNTLLSVQRYTIDNISSALAVFREDGRLQLTNPVFRDTWQLEETFLAEQPHISILTRAMRPLFAVDDSTWPVIQNDFIGKVMARQNRMERMELADGRILDATYVALPDGGSLLSQVDVTDSYKLAQSLMADKQALTEADLLKTKFLANVSYELRNPLTSIQGFTEVLEKEFFGRLNEKQSEYVKSVLLASQRLAHLIDAIIDITSIDAGFLQLKQKAFAIDAVCEEAVQHAKHHLGKNEANISVTIEKSLPLVFADPLRIEQVITQLLRHALRLSTHAMPITLSCKRYEDTVQIEITDHAHHVASNESQEPYDYSSVGLAFTIAKSLLQLHQANLHVDQNADGAYITRFYLPISNGV